MTFCQLGYNGRVDKPYKLAYIDDHAREAIVMYNEKEDQFGMMSRKFLYLDSHNVPIRCETFSLHGRMTWFEQNFHKKSSKPQVYLALLFQEGIILVRLLHGKLAYRTL